MWGIRCVADCGWMASIDLDNIPSPLHRVLQSFQSSPNALEICLFLSIKIRSRLMNENRPDVGIIAGYYSGTLTVAS
jgi:hypothetical protein